MVDIWLKQMDYHSKSVFSKDSNKPFQLLYYTILNTSSEHVQFLAKAYLISRVAEALILGTMMVGQASAFQPNYNKAVIAAGRIFKLLDRKPLIDSASGDDASGLRLVCKRI